MTGVGEARLRLLADAAALCNFFDEGIIVLYADGGDVKGVEFYIHVVERIFQRDERGGYGRSVLFYRSYSAIRDLLGHNEAVANKD